MLDVYPGQIGNDKQGDIVESEINTSKTTEPNHKPRKSDAQLFAHLEPKVFCTKCMAGKEGQYTLQWGLLAQYFQVPRTMTVQGQYTRHLSDAG